MIAALIIVARLTGYLIAAWLWTVGGNKICKFVLNAAEIRPDTASSSASSSSAMAGGLNAQTFAAGRFIGGLERTIIVLGLVAGSWEVVASVIALKSVARFKELDHQLKAEYFLIGSLTSVLWSFLMAGAVVYYDKTLGLHLMAVLKGLFPATK
jgi:hypothetical protein